MLRENHSAQYYQEQTCSATFEVPSTLMPPLLLFCMIKTKLSPIFGGYCT